MVALNPTAEELNKQTLAETNITGLGGSDTKEKDFSAYGGLKSFMPDATKMYNAMYGVSEEEQAKEDRIRLGMNMLTFFTQMGAEASKPGATALGAANIAGASTAQQYLKQMENDKTREDKKKSGVIDLASKLATFDAAKSKANTTKLYTNTTGTPIILADGQRVLPKSNIRLSEQGLINAGDNANLLVPYEKSQQEKAQVSKPVVINNVEDFKAKLQLGDLNPITNKAWEKGDKVSLTAEKENLLGVGTVSTYVEPKTYTDEFKEVRYLSGPNEGKLVSEVLTDNKIENKLPLDTDNISNGEVTSNIPNLKKLNVDQFDNAAKLRKEIKDGTKEFMGIQRSFNNIKKFYENRGEISDYSLAVAYAKIIDPGTAAREGEVAAIANSGALSQAVKTQLINALVGGGKLPERVRVGIFNRSADIFNEERDKATSLISNTESLWEVQVGKGQSKWINTQKVDDKFDESGYKKVDPDSDQTQFVFKSDVLSKMNLKDLQKIVQEQKLNSTELSELKIIIQQKIQDRDKKTK
jgi:hypothetical protein